MAPHSGQTKLMGLMAKIGVCLKGSVFVMHERSRPLGIGFISLNQVSIPPMLRVGFGFTQRWVIRTDMGCKRLVALQLEIAHHLIESFSIWRTRRLKPPSALRATKTVEATFFNPYNRAGHVDHFLT
jgi:hypothetical protein